MAEGGEREQVHTVHVQYRGLCTVCEREKEGGREG